MRTPLCTPRSPDHYDANGHFVGDYPANYLINQAMADRVGAGTEQAYSHDVTTGSFSSTSTGTEYNHGDIDLDAGPEVTIGRRLSDDDAERALLEAAKAGAHESLEGVNLDESLPALMTEV